ncbi:hyaluronidase PH-20-like [Tenrec ecaudatus]|uniref:hyaluronidase PH-20-like n=1 Tax=Tenrec ecaudatus TaxID=94439 RepID=UPI003F5A859F
MGVLGITHISSGCVGCWGASQTVLVFLLLPCCLSLQCAAPNVFSNDSFLWAWNSPIEFCIDRYNVSLDLKLFSLIGSPRIQETGQRLVIFYATKLGLYPFIKDKTGMFENGGLPQLGNLNDHLTEALKDIVSTVRANQTGLAVIDWEEWRPLWDRNWKPKNIYRDLSNELVQQQNAQLSLSEATKVAKQDFETAGKAFYLETLKLAKLLRPQYLWGFYLFPECYNHVYTRPGYDGSCFEIEKRRNDQLFWLWKESTAFFPNIYLHSRLNSTPLAALFVRNRVQEALRLSALRDPKNPVPIYFYARPVFTDMPSKYHSQYDLENTLGESVALGVSGIIFWASVNLSQNAQACTTLANYLTTTLNPYIINLTLAAKMCSQVLCQGLGICVRKDWNSSDYLHLNPDNFAIQAGNNGKLTVNGKPTIEDLKYFSEKFNCLCYTNYACKLTDDIENTDIDNIKVCIANNICIGNLVDKKSTSYSFRNKGKPLAAEWSCVSEANLSGYLKDNCSKTTISTNDQENSQDTDGENTSNFEKKEKVTTKPSKSLMLVPFDIHILLILVSLKFLYSSI